MGTLLADSVRLRARAGFETWGARRMLALMPAALAVLSGAGGCLVDSRDRSQAQLVLAVDVPLGQTDIKTSALTPTPAELWDPQGLFRLTAFPKLVRVAVEAGDYELRTATWPDPVEGVVTPEGPAGEVEVTLEVPAGPDRQLRALGFVVDQGRVLVYAEEAPVSLDLIAGEPEVVTLPMTRAPSGSVMATVRCREGSAAPWRPIALSLVDAKALVLHPSQDLVVGEQGSLGVEIASVPVGRPHWARIKVYNALRQVTTQLDVRQPTFAVTKENERGVVDVVIPCSF